MNAVASILDNSLSSALIIEDDADWDVNLKTQLTQFAHRSGSKRDGKASFGRQCRKERRRMNRRRQWGGIQRELYGCGEDRTSGFLQGSIDPSDDQLAVW